MVNVTIEKLVTIKNYSAGIDGNLLVVTEDQVSPITIIGHKGEPKDIHVLLCTAAITDSELQDELAGYCDEYTPCNRVIVVSKKFLKMRNKKQLALLQIESSRVGVTNQKTNLDGIITGEIDAIEKYGKWCTYRAVNKAKRVKEKSIKKATFLMHHNYKKCCKVEKKVAQAAENASKKNFESESSSMNNGQSPAGANA